MMLGRLISVSASAALSATVRPYEPVLMFGFSPLEEPSVLLNIECFESV